MVKKMQKMETVNNAILKAQLYGERHAEPSLQVSQPSEHR